MHQARIERMQEAREKSAALKARGGGEPEPDKAGVDGRKVYKGPTGAQAERRRREAGRGYGRGAASEAGTPTPGDVRRARDPLMDSGGASLFSGYSGAGGVTGPGASKIAASLR